jgi:hypothetical protein
MQIELDDDETEALLAMLCIGIVALRDTIAGEPNPNANVIREQRLISLQRLQNKLFAQTN